jgi:glutathione S-transferase
MSLIFYYAPMTSATRIHWALEELGIPFEKRKVDLAKGEQKTPEFLAQNPNGKVPLLVDDGAAIFESLAILLYLGERYGVDQGLFPTERVERACAVTWMCWAQVSLAEVATRVLRNTSERIPEGERNEKAAAAARTELHDLLAIADKAMEGKAYLLGEKFSFADLAIAGYAPFFTHVGADLSKFENVQAWFTRCTTRPALARAMQS